MEDLLPALEARGYDVAVLHTTGIGGRAFEALAAEGRFAAVMDFSLAGAQRTTSAARSSPPGRTARGRRKRGIPQIVAPGAIDMIDFPTWRPPPIAGEQRNHHAHDRLLASVTARADERRGVARAIADKLAAASKVRPSTSCRVGTRAGIVPASLFTSRMRCRPSSTKPARPRSPPTDWWKSRRTSTTRCSAIRRWLCSIDGSAPGLFHAEAQGRRALDDGHRQGPGARLRRCGHAHAVRDAPRHREGARPPREIADLARPVRSGQRSALAQDAGRRNLRARLLAHPSPGNR